MPRSRLRGGNTNRAPYECTRNKTRRASTTSFTRHPEIAGGGRLSRTGSPRRRSPKHGHNPIARFPLFLDFLSSYLAVHARVDTDSNRRQSCIANRSRHIGRKRARRSLSRIVVGRKPAGARRSFSARVGDVKRARVDNILSAVASGGGALVGRSVTTNRPGPIGITLIITLQRRGVFPVRPQRKNTDKITTTRTRVFSSRPENTPVNISCNFYWTAHTAIASFRRTRQFGIRSVGRHLSLCIFPENLHRNCQ